MGNETMTLSKGGGCLFSMKVVKFSLLENVGPHGSRGFEKKIMGKTVRLVFERRVKLQRYQHTYGILY